MCQNIQLFILPYSGARANQFSDICMKLEKKIKIDTIEYAGRGRRAREPFLLEYSLFIDDIKEYIVKHRDPSLPYALLGYSIGGLFAYDLLAKGCLKEDPKHLFICACEDARQQLPVISDLPEDKFWDIIIGLGGVDRRLINNKIFLKLFSKTLRSDFHVAEQHSYSITDKSITCPVSVLYSEKDTPFLSIRGWQEVCEQRITFIQFEGDHFFALEYPDLFAKVICEQLKV